MHKTVLAALGAGLLALAATAAFTPVFGQGTPGVTNKKHSATLVRKNVESATERKRVDKRRGRSIAKTESKTVPLVPPGGPHVVAPPPKFGETGRSAFGKEGIDCYPRRDPGYYFVAGPQPSACCRGTAPPLPVPK